MGDAPQLWPSFPAAGVAVLPEVSLVISDNGLIQKKGNLIGSLNVVLVIRLGLEPKTPTLKVLCSTD